MSGSRIRRRWFIALFAGLLAIGCTTAGLSTGNGTTAPVTITVAAAASLEAVLGAIAPTFTTAHPNITISYSFAASGTLQRQIEQGAPVDVFFSAADQQMDALVEKNLILANSRRDIVTNRLVLIAPQSSSLKVAGLDELKASDIDRFAVGAFRSVPAGQYAEQVLQSMGLLSEFTSKFVFGNSVRSVLAAVSTGSADVGLVYATDAALSDRVQVLAKVPTHTHSPIVYPAAVVQASQQPDAAQTFIEFLQTEPAQVHFVELGFGPGPQ